MPAKIDTVEVGSSAIRSQIKDICAAVSALKQDVQANGSAGTTGEVIANITLAFRHLEDAAMRLGKAIQASTDGVSPLGGPVTPRA